MFSPFWMCFSISLLFLNFLGEDDVFLCCSQRVRCFSYAFDAFFGRGEHCGRIWERGILFWVERGLGMFFFFSGDLLLFLIFFDFCSENRWFMSA